MDRIEVDGHILEWERRGQAGQLTVRPLSSGVPAFGSGTTFRLTVAFAPVNLACFFESISAS